MTGSFSYREVPNCLGFFRIVSHGVILSVSLPGAYKNKHAPAEMFGMSHAQISRTCRSSRAGPCGRLRRAFGTFPSSFALRRIVIVEKLISGTLPVPRFTAVADKLITLPLWAEQHALLGIE